MKIVNGVFYYTLTEVGREVGWQPNLLAYRIKNCGYPRGTMLEGCVKPHWTAAEVEVIRQYMQHEADNHIKHTRKLAPMPEVNDPVKTKKDITGDARIRAGYMSQQDIARVLVDWGVYSKDEASAQPSISRYLKKGIIPKPDLVTGVGVFWKNHTALKICKFMETRRKLNADKQNKKPVEPMGDE